jgi:hypothetical protein
MEETSLQFDTGGLNMARAYEGRRDIGRLVCTVVLGVVVLAGWHPAVANEVVNWNNTALSALIAAGHNNVTLTRGLTMVHVAIHDALNAINRRYESYVFEGAAEANAAPEAAVATAARDVLVLAIPSFGTPAQQVAAIAEADAAYTAALTKIPDGAGKTSGITVGRAAAAAIVGLRKDDDAIKDSPYTPGGAPGQWRPHPNPVPPDPPVPTAALASGYVASILPGWGNVTPFTLLSGIQFRPAGPPLLTSEAYAKDFQEVKSIGGKTSTERTPEQTQIARYWYEGSPQGWNRITRVVAAARHLDLWEHARLLALVNLAMADGFIAGFNTRYYFNFWRPVTAIRFADTDGNSSTAPDPEWESFLNTPPVPDYPSTHSVLGGAAAGALAEYFGMDQVAFAMTSGAPFAGLTRSFTSFSQAAQENADSRVYAGIHFRTACRDGIALGQKIGRRAARMFLLPSASKS